MRLLLKITLGVFGLFSLMIGLRFILGRNSAPDEPWFLIHGYSYQITRVTQSGKVDTLHTPDGLPVYGSVFSYEDGWLWGWLTTPQTRFWHLSRMRLDGSHLQQVSQQPMHEEFLGLSGDRKWVIFTGEEYTRDIYRVRTNGSWPHRLVDLPGHDRAIGFAADGDWLLFVNGYYLYDLWRVNTNTGEMQQLTHNLHIEGASLSPDHQWVYIRFKDYEHLNQGSDLGRLRVDGTDFEQLTYTRTVNPFASGIYRAWYLQMDGVSKLSPISPDGRWILYYATTPPTGGDFFTMRADGQSVYQLHIEGEILGWSPDSEWIYYKFIRNFGRTWQRPGFFYRIHPDGSGGQLLSPSVFVTDGRLAEDGKWIFVEVMDDPTKCYCVKDYYGVATDGTGTWRIGGGMSSVHVDRLSPDGKWYYFLIQSYDNQHEDLYRIPVGATQQAELVTQFQTTPYEFNDALGWFESPHKAWSPLLILGCGVGGMGVWGWGAWRSRQGRKTTRKGVTGVIV